MGHVTPILLKKGWDLDGPGSSRGIRTLAAKDCRRRWRLQIQRLVFDRLAASSAAHPGLVLLKLLQPGRANALMADKEVKTDPRNGR